MSVIGSLYGSLLRPETLVLTVTFSSRENLLHESCTDRMDRLAVVKPSFILGRGETGIAWAPSTQLHTEPLFLSCERKGDSGEFSGIATERASALVSAEPTQLVRWSRLRS